MSLESHLVDLLDLIPLQAIAARKLRFPVFQRHEKNTCASMKQLQMISHETLAYRCFIRTFRTHCYPICKKFEHINTSPVVPLSLLLHHSLPAATLSPQPPCPELKPYTSAVSLVLNVRNDLFSPSIITCGF